MTALAPYHDLIARKRVAFEPRGLVCVPELDTRLKPHQAYVVDFALRTGCAGMYLDTGLGKTFAALEWARHIVEASNRPVLMLAPLAVGPQHAREAERFGIDAVYRRQPTSSDRARTHDAAAFPVKLWQELASPVWMTVDQTKVLNVKVAREDKDERHLCPLQFDVIDRALILYSNPGDTIYSPFMGIGSEGVRSIAMGRRFLGTELKDTYYRQAVKNLREAEGAASQATLFEVGRPA